MNDSIYTLGMLCIFNLLGGIAIGKGLRDVLARRFKGVWFYFIWGGMFGVMPLAFGGSGPIPYAIYVQAFVLIAAVAVMAFLPEQFFASLSSPPVIATGIGAIFFLAGLAGFFLTLRQDVGGALLLGGMFTLVGGGFMVAGISQALKR